MQDRLNPSEEIINNLKIYNTFSHDEQKKVEVFKYLSTLYTKALSNPRTPKEIMNDMSSLSDEMLIYLMVEIKMMIKEKNCLPFHRREQDCLLAYFKGLSIAFENIDDLTLSSEKIKKIHRACTDTTVVSMEQIKTHNSGNYRDNDKEVIVLPISYATLSGFEHLIELIHQGVIPSLSISSGNDAKKLDKVNAELVSCEYTNAILKYALFKYDPQTEVDSTCLLHNINNYLNDEIKFFKIYEKVDETRIIRMLSKNKIRIRLVAKIKEKIKFLDDAKEKEKDIVKKQEYRLSIADLSIFNDKICRLKKTINSYIELIYNLNSSKLTDVIQSIHSENVLNFNQQYNTFLDYELLQIKRNTIDQAMQRYHVTTRSDLAQTFYYHLLNSLGADNKKEVIHFEFAALNEIDGLMEYLIQKFNAEVDQLKDKTPDEKLYFIFKFVQLFLFVHPFLDGNNRVFVNALANRLLIQHGFPPAVYYNPFIFYVLSVPEIVELVKLACANYLAMQEFVKFGINPYFDFAQKDLTNEDIAMLGKFTTPIRQFFEKQKANECLSEIQNFMDSVFFSKFTAEPKFFQPISKAYELVEADLNQLKQCKTTNEIYECLLNCAKLREDQGYHEIVNRYTELLVEKLLGEKRRFGKTV